MRQVHCVVLDAEADALEEPPYPGDLGQRIFDTVSREGWQKWLERQVLIINENQLSSADPQAIDLIMRREKTVLDAARSSDFDVDKLMNTIALTSKIH